MPKYAALIYGDESGMASATPEQMGQMMEEYNVYTESLMAAGIMKGGDALQSVSTATTVRVRDGATSTTDGPFAETKESLGGFYIYDCKDLDEAIEWAAKVPGAKYGCIEVRPIMVFD